MAMTRPSPKRGAPASPAPPQEGPGSLGRWILFSGLLHAAIISASLFVIPNLPFRTAPSYPVYSVELVGGEKLGGLRLGSEIRPAPPPKKEVKKLKAEPPRPVEKPKEKKKVKETPPRAPEKVAVRQAKEEVREVKKEVTEEAKEEKGVSGEVRERLIQAALDRVRNRAQAEQKKKSDVLSTGPGEGEGAAAPGAGGVGGGIVKGIEFLRYRNHMLQRIKEMWTWVGRRTDLEVTVRFGIQENGEIFGIRIAQPSGDLSYDDSVIRAVKKASPLPPPPESYRRDFMQVELVFRPKDLDG